MKKMIILVLLFSICFTQNKNNNRKKNNNRNVNQTLFSSMNEEAKQIFYQSEKLSPEKASLLQLAVPFPFVNLGYSYSNNWKKGAMVDIAIAALIVAREDFKDSDDCRYMFICDDADNAEIAMGIIALYKVFKANQLAETYNNKLFKKLFGVRKPRFSLNYSKDIGSPELSLIIPIN